MSGAAGAPEAVRQFGVDTGPLAARSADFAAQLVQAGLIWPMLG